MVYCIILKSKNIKFLYLFYFIMINEKTSKIENKIIKPTILSHQRTYNNQSFYDLDENISEMKINIKQYQTIKKKNLFLEGKSPIKNQTKPKIALTRLNTITNNKNKNKNFDVYSITTSSSYNDKAVKKVTFSTVEIIRVEKYKKENAINNFSKALIQKNMDEVQNKSKKNETNCFIF